MPAAISCVMATKDRPGFFQIALACFARQTSPGLELIVVDDGDTAVESLCSGIERVRYIRLDRPTPWGAKLNLGIASAAGRWIQKLDDDDYYNPVFLTTVASCLQKPEAEACVVAWDCFYILHTGDSTVRYSGHGWKAGGTLCFPRSMWDRRPFRELPRSVDSWFLSDHNPRLTRVCAPEQYLLVRHGRNTWRSMQGGLDADAYLRTRPVYEPGLDALVDPAAAAFYRSLA
jgi:glycosyltransferase involved in cell wall biosynthesis